MIKNIVFDLGNVILKYDPENMLNDFSLSDDDKNLFIKEVFESSLWRDCDAGAGYHDTVLLPVKKKLPRRLHKVFSAICCRYDMEQRRMPETVGIRELISELKQNGYRLYLLSNVSINFHIFAKKLQVLSDFDGLFASCDFCLLKPEKEIYSTFFRCFSLLPEECLFIDDTPANVEASINAGMPAVNFNSCTEDVGVLRRKLNEKKIKVSL